MQADDDEDEILMEKSHINILPLNSMNDSHLLERIYEVIKRLFEIKRAHKVNANIYFNFIPNAFFFSSNRHSSLIMNRI